MCLIASSGCRPLFHSAHIRPDRQQAQIIAVSSRPIETFKSSWRNIPEKADCNILYQYKKMPVKQLLFQHFQSVQVRADMYHIYSFFLEVKQSQFQITMATWYKPVLDYHGHKSFWMLYINK